MASGAECYAARVTCPSRRAAERLVERAREERERREALASRVRMELDAVVGLLSSRYRATSVTLFGSLAWGGFHEASDVDLAVTGVTPRDRALATADAEAALGREVQILDLDEVPESLRERVISHGVSLA